MTAYVGSDQRSWCIITAKDTENQHPEMWGTPSAALWIMMAGSTWKPILRTFVANQ